MSAAAETGLFLDGLRCSGCVNRVERALRSSAGVLEASVNYTTHRALVRYDPDQTTSGALVRAIEALGFEATPYSPEALERPHQRDARQALVRLLIAGFFAANVMMIAIALYIGAIEGVDPATRRGLRWLAVGLSLPVVTWCALPFWQGAWNGLVRREITIDLPIVLGIATAFATNIAGTLAETEDLYVDSAAMIVFLILLGRTLERGARSRAAQAVDRLSALTPATALRLGANGEWTEVPAESLVAGDRVIVAPGEIVPADGVVTRGASEFDESLLTGESMPVVKRVGDATTGGTLNLMGEIEFEVRESVSSGTLARLAALLERAQTERPRIQRLADRVAAVFAPSVLALAGLTALAWAFAGASFAEIAFTASAVLIVACPCALGLATPAAVTAAIGRAATAGVIVKSGEALERCATLDHCVLDKTGTVTTGRLEIAAVEVARGETVASVVAAAARVEGSSTHPIARALVAYSASHSDVPASLVADPLAAADASGERRAVAGRGVELVGEAGALRVGTLDFVGELGRPVPDDLLQRGADLAKRGVSLAWVADEERALGVIGFVDPVREDAAEALAQLSKLGIGAELVTGDHAGAAEAVADAAGMPRSSVHAGATPESKVEHVRRAREGGANVLVVGDGINDAAALAAADVGIAMASGSDVALHAADLVVRNSRLGAVPEAIELSRATLRRIRENLGFAVLYNAVAIPLAATGWLTPLWAALAMSASSLVVTGNSIRLSRWKPAAPESTK